MGNTKQKQENTTRRLDPKKGETDFSKIILTWLYSYEVFFNLFNINNKTGTGCFVQVSKFGKYYSHLPIEQLVPVLVWV